jgi:inner membrane protein
MDPLSQGVLGALAPQSAVSRENQSKKHLFLAGIAGFLSGMAADLDILIRSNSDPLLYLEYHRQFTHSLIFIPVGGLLCAGLLYWIIYRRYLSFKMTWIYCTLGYATHALLDCCTSYGTQLFWPFSDYRVAWNNVSIVDPLFTLPLLALIILAAWRRDRRWAWGGLAYALLYLGLGIVQRERAESLGFELAESRGHQPVRLVAKPTFGNLILWKVVYETETDFHVDAVRVSFSTHSYSGESIEKLDVARDLPWVKADSVTAADIERFRWFSDGFIALDPGDENFVIDVRYSFVPNRIAPLWGIMIDPKAPDAHARFLTARNPTEAHKKRVMEMLRGEN